ncbi:MAG: hypothetical protein U5K54_30045 [Cytophagales bacterium]|nr:hypothetical protein [Cytophagales bacterium]
MDAQRQINDSWVILLLPGVATQVDGSGGDLAATYPSPAVANNAITSAKILDGTIATGDVVANDAITTLKVLDGAINKIQNLPIQQ